MATARRKEVLLVAGLALVVVAVVALVALTGGSPKPAPKPPAPARGIDPLAFMPADATTTLDLDTDVPAVAVAAAELVPRIPGSTLTQAQVERLVGGRMAVAFGAGRFYLAAVTHAAAPQGATKQGGTVVVAPHAVTPRGGARAAFDARLAGLPASSARVAFDGGRLLAAESPKLAATAWGKSLRQGAAVLVTRGNEVAVPFRVQTAGGAALPFGSGPVAPSTAGAGPVVAGVRNPAQTLAFLRSAGMIPGLDALSRAPGFLRPDLANLGPEATFTTDLKQITVRMTPPDAGDWATKLNRLDALSGLIRFAGIADVRIDRGADGAYTIQENGTLVGRAGVYGNVVVVTTSPTTDLRAAARAPVTPPPGGAAGGLTVRMAASVFGPLLPALARGHVGDVSGWARVEPTELTGELTVPVR